MSNEKSTIHRFETEAAARDAAAAKSRARSTTFYVIESPCEASPDRPWCADTDGLTRSWERVVATYHNGRLV